MARLTFTILGCGSSGGVPRIGGKWRVLLPDRVFESNAAPQGVAPNSPAPPASRPVWPPDNP